MKPRFGTTARLCVSLLLVLAVSPVTAPFLTCSLDVLFDHPAALGSPVVHAKPSADEPIVGLAGCPDLPHPPDAATRRVEGVFNPPPTRVLLHLPLRI